VNQLSVRGFEGNRRHWIERVAGNEFAVTPGICPGTAGKQGKHRKNQSFLHRFFHCSFLITIFLPLID